MPQQINTQHIIDANVMLIKPIAGPDGVNTRTELLYNNGKRKTKNMRPLRFIEYACRHRYNTYPHIKAEVKTLIDVSSKPPFFLPDPQSLAFFSTHSDRVPENCWINVRYVQKIEHYKTSKSKVYLYGGHTLIVNVSEYTLRHQYQNGLHLAYTLIRQKIESGELIRKYDQTQHDELVSVIRDFISIFKEIRLALMNEHRYYHPKIAEDPPYKNY
ncbi:competence protein ComK [Staphylococcus americanisciuri]|uniref:Competence protein ComK n=1 Tax=Staphylococcus americanisciuri TaxID=2973940 RepID=A0ABT2F2H1_9STAP|nr:competence protein ComK [Staphylococcus americanisciuri]MCS4486655.1 competence protein ComK [Staphylococcus americanisciuri]